MAEHASIRIIGSPALVRAVAEQQRRYRPRDGRAPSRGASAAPRPRIARHHHPTSSPPRRPARSARGDAAQYAGILAALLEQVETGLRGGELQTHFQKGWLNGYGRDTLAALAAIGEELDDLVRSAGEGIRQVPPASRQLSTAALALAHRRPGVHRRRHRYR